MSSIITDIEFVVGRGQQYDPVPGATQYRNPALKNRSYRPNSEIIGYLASSKFTVVNDTVNDIYGFDLLGGITFQNGNAWFVHLFSNEFTTDVTGQATLLDSSYFIRNIYMPQAVNDAAVKSRVELFIQQHEPEVLERLLGYALYKEFFDSITGPTPAAKYTDLLFGAEYTDGNGYPQKWMGFLNPQKNSILANYVYYQYMTDNNTLTTAGGESKQKSEGGFRTDATQKAVRAWNEMRLWIMQLIDYLESRKADYPQWQDYCFPEAFFGNVNQFGI